jgi:membrane protein implicated in regulation of membrane protease activity
MGQRMLYRLTWLAVAMSLGHHLDHVLRGNAVGWPLTGEVNAFTISLVVYPVIAAGLLLYRAGRVGPGFWALVSGGGAVFVGAVHFGPAAVEPPELILGHYQPPALGWLALGWLVAFVAVLAVTSVYETRLWVRRRRTPYNHAERLVSSSGRALQPDRRGQGGPAWGRYRSRPPRV